MFGHFVLLWVEHFFMKQSWSNEQGNDITFNVVYE